MKTIYTYYRNTKTDEYLMRQEFVNLPPKMKTRMESSAVYFYNIYDKTPVKSLDLTNLVEITQKQWLDQQEKLGVW